MAADKLGPTVGGWELGTLLAVEGKEDCTDPRCRRMIYRDEAHVRPGCLGWHCPDCGKPTSSQGHKCPERGEV